jgi:peptidoglycan/xylan/chitin deacetylase (PgdA/CDA1 family)
MIYTGTAAVALTFDDGPDPTYTPQILDLLKKYKVHATFCLIGKKVQAYPSLVRRIVAEGHTLCNHSWAHDLSLYRNSDGHIRADMQVTLDAIHAAAPGSKVKYFRAPGGNFSTREVQIAASLGMRSIYWQVDPRDWDTATYGTGSSMAAHIIHEVETHVRQGGIVLSHDAGPRSGTVLAYQTLIPWFQKVGYKLIPMPV